MIPAARERMDGIFDEENDLRDSTTTTASSPRPGPTAGDDVPGMRVGRAVAILISLFVAGLFGLAYLSYRRDIRQARERISVGSRIVGTPCGPIEYTVAGGGPPVLVVHGAGGGYDQGMDFAKPLVQSGFRVIAMSRFGYLRTPLPADASAAAQADAHACLLDALNVERAAVAGASAGAPSSMQFALRHPERTAALVLLVPAAYPAHIRQEPGGAMPKRTSAETAFLIDTALKSDFLFWLAPRIARKTMIRAILATPPSVVENASAEERARVAEVLDQILPVSPRRLGLLNDAAITPSLPRYELERVAAPTLIISVADDLFGTYDGARYSAEHIPRARFIGYETGGHLWVGHHKEVWAEIAAFLKNAA
jgi:2-hydroxy-6-oxonona-2,4-dienedioate hydrolase